MRMVACDLDGTIVRTDGRISPRTLAALTACERLGIHVVFVTGRPPRWMNPIVEMTGHQGLALCGNGAVVLNLATGDVVSSRALSAAAVLAVTERLRERIPGAAFALETLDGYRREADYMPVHTADPEALTGPVPKLLHDAPTVVKVLCKQSADHYGELSSDELLVLAREALGDLAEAVHSDPNGHMLEISASGVTKATALAWLAGELGVEAGDVIAFGDMPNDIPMLTWAGTGYAMSGGHPDAIAAASRQAPPCDQDGVAQVIEALLSERGPRVGR
ncbi:Cof-type HAD-IIB family hydrolase [Kineosporia rhizophila]|uniref:HAD family hydrolase n=1 Tax=Kineosporia TaxID=49184 RepID=UPI001E290C99|nr:MULTISPECIES: HAD family hydrolase [Kineosporia]MCE0536964.1 Cof-type HAD-IIB family hydrolase [Kineosporia rhizophila]GLY19120.1 hydrolase [Kineosporia sp. NBRC 101677]